MPTRHRLQLTDKPLRFVTTTCVEWLPILQGATYMAIVADSLNFVSAKYKVDILGYVLMPNHIHLLLFLEKPAELSSLMRDFKKFTSSMLYRQLEKEKKKGLLSKITTDRQRGNIKIWKDGFDDFAINNPRTLNVKLKYIHENPVRKDLVALAEDYSYSSAMFYKHETQGAVKVVHYLEAIGVASQYSYGIIY